MSRPKNDIGIKRIEYITKDDVETSKTMMTIMGLCNGTTLKCTFNDHKGGIETRRFKEFHFKDGNKQFDPFCEGWGLIPVRIHYKNGDCEFGFKYFDRTEIVTRKNGKLKPFYIKDGYIDDITGELVCDLDDAHNGVQYRVLRKLPFFNEKIRDMAKHERDNTFEQIMSLLISDFCVSNAQYSIPPKSKYQEKMPWVESDGSYDDRGYDYKISYGDGGNWMYIDKNKSKKTNCYSYWKSMYVDVRRASYVYGIIPLSDLYTIHREIGWKDEVEVWNNLDSTLIGEF